MQEKRRKVQMERLWWKSRDGIEQQEPVGHDWIWM
jgi:hypothetical protein